MRNDDGNLDSRTKFQDTKVEDHNYILNQLPHSNRSVFLAQLRFLFSLVLVTALFVTIKHNIEKSSFAVFDNSNSNIGSGLSNDQTTDTLEGGSDTAFDWLTVSILITYTKTDAALL